MAQRLGIAIAITVATALRVGAQSPRAVPPQIDRYFKLARAEYSGERAKELVAYMGAWARWPGNKAFDASLDRVVSQLRTAGYVLEDSAPKSALLTYRIEKRQLRALAWDLIDASLTVVGDRTPLLKMATNLNMLAINSYSTPDSGVVADVVDVGRGTPADYDRVKVDGKIVLADGSVGQVFGEAVQKRGAVGVLTYRMPAYTKPEINRSSIQFASIPQDTVRKGWGMPISRGAVDSLRALLARGPVRVRAIATTRLFSSVERTVIAEVRGTSLPGERLVFSAHVQENGANDDASGVGAQGELARVLAVLSKNGSVQPKRTITMIFGNETIQTQRFLADDSVRARGIKWGISLDMVGEDTRKTGGTFLIEKMVDPSAVWTRGEDHHSEWGGRPLKKEQIIPHYFNDFLLDRALDQASTNGWVVQTNPYEGGSDHTPYNAFKKPGVLFWHFTDQFYHTDGDRIDMVSATSLQNVGITAVVSALTLTSADGEMARTIVAQLERAAIKRLDTEVALSLAAIAKGGKVADEVEIMEAWTDYYVASIGTTADIEVGASSAQTTAAIEAAKGRVRAAGAARVAKLR